MSLYILNRIVSHLASVLKCKSKLSQKWIYKLDRRIKKAIFSKFCYKNLICPWSEDRRVGWNKKHLRDPVEANASKKKDRNTCKTGNHEYDWSDDNFVTQSKYLVCNKTLICLENKRIVGEKICTWWVFFLPSQTFSLVM